jgi:hypothetical protein
MPDELQPAIGTGEKKPSLFRSKQASEGILADPSVRDELNSLSTRLRLSEERYIDLRRKLQLIEQNMLSNHKRAMLEVKNAISDMLAMRKTVDDVENKLILAIKELQLTAKKEDVDVIRKYFELWSPVSFATVNQVDKMIKEAFEEQKQNEQEAQG